MKQSSDDYYNENNLILLCDYHHRQYHQKYPRVNGKTFCEYMKNCIIKNTTIMMKSNSKLKKKIKS